MVSHSPIKKPHSAKLSRAYVLHVGVNLHVWGINGDMQVLNINIKNIAMYFGINMMIFQRTLKNFFIIFLQKVTIFLAKAQFLVQFVHNLHPKLRFLR